MHQMILNKYRNCLILSLQLCKKWQPECPEQIRLILCIWLIFIHITQICDIADI